MGAKKPSAADRYDKLARALDGAIALGYTAEEGYLEERGIRSEMPADERSWLAAWLIGEGWTKA